jgi:flagellar protein FliO/FliZ
MKPSLKTLNTRVLAAIGTVAMWAAPTVTSASGARFGAPSVASVREPLNSGSGALQVLLSLALVVGAILLLGWLARRLRVLPRGRGGALRVVDEVALGSKERAVIIEVDGARLVLGVGDGRVVMLHKSDPSVAPGVSSSALDQVPAAPLPYRFAELLGKGFGR